MLPLANLIIGTSGQPDDCGPVGEPVQTRFPSGAVNCCILVKPSSRRGTTRRPTSPVRCQGTSGMQFILRRLPTSSAAHAARKTSDIAEMSAFGLRILVHSSECTNDCGDRPFQVCRYYREHALPTMHGAGAAGDAAFIAQRTPMPGFLPKGRATLSSLLLRVRAVTVGGHVR